MPSYQAATAAPAYDPTAATGFHGYGGFWIRVLAAIIDGAVTSAIVFPMIFILALAMGLSSAGSRQPNPAVALGFLAIWFPIALGIPWIYSAAMESSRHQATLGKMAVGLKVTDIYGARISFGRATGRHFGKVVSAIALYIGFIMVGFTERKQGLHDMIAGTVVLKK